MRNTTTRLWLSTFVFLACLLTFTTAWAGAEDDYLRIYAIIDDADGLSAKGKADLAQSKYAEAHKELIAFKKANPAWNKSTVAYRINYVAEKLAPKAEVVKPEAPAITSAPQSDSKTATPDVTGPQVKLISAGDEPRKALRLHPAVGTKQSLTMTMKMEMDMGAATGGMPPMTMPEMKLGTDATVRSVAPNGDITFDLLFTESGIVGDTDPSNPMSAMMADGMATLKGSTATSTMSDRGTMISKSFKVSENAAPMVRQSFEQSKESFTQITLPEEAVGVGAKWEVKEKQSTQGMSVDQTSLFEITAIQGDILTLRATVNQHAANQKIENPSMPGMKMDLTKLTSEGSGTGKVDLSKVLPIQVEMKMKSETSMSMNLGGQKQPMTMKMDMTMRIESK